MNRFVLLFSVVIFLSGPVLGQGRSQKQSPDLQVDRFELDVARLRKNVGTLKCWVRSTAWKPLKNVQVSVELIGANGSSKSITLGTFKNISAGRVVEAKQKSKDLPDVQRYRVTLFQEGSGNSRKYVYEGQKDQKRPKLVSSNTNVSGINGVGGGNASPGSRSGGPEKLNVGMDTPFKGKNDLELGHVTFWRTGEGTLRVRGGLRNGRDHAVTQTTITFTLPGTNGKNVKRKLKMNKTLKSGEIYPFSKEFTGIGNGNMASFQFSFKTDPNNSESVSMSWSDVKDQLSPAPNQGKSSTTTSGQPGKTKTRKSQYPLLSLHGIRVVKGHERGRDLMSEVYLLKMRAQVNGSAVKPRGKFKFAVYEAGESRLKQTLRIQPNQFEPAPAKFTVDQVNVGKGYWDKQNQMLYLALFKVVDIHSDVHLDVMLDAGSSGRWTFQGLGPPFKNSPIPPDQVR